VVDPLFRRGVLFFSGGIGEDVLRNVFSSKDLFRDQVKARKKQGGVNHEISIKSTRKD
jgi:hypothetical protein